MNPRLPGPADPGEVRRRAEAQLEAEELEDLDSVELRRVVHELRVHQLELEMQNEALVEARQLAEAGWERFQELFDSAPAGYFSVDRNGAILEVNLAGAGVRVRLLGAGSADGKVLQLAALDITELGAAREQALQRRVERLAAQLEAAGAELAGIRRMLAGAAP